ncbi:MAG: NAD(+) diphosphatase [Pseudomonadota bacterium]
MTTHNEASARSAFAGNRLIRNEAMRKDAVLEAALADPGTRAIVFHGGHVAEAEDGGVVHALNGFGGEEAVSGPVLLGYDGETAMVGVRLPERRDAQGQPLGLALRTLGIVTPDRVAPDMLGALAEAGGLLAWHAAHRFCGTCGTEMRATDAGWKRECPQCGAQAFPRTDPVVIMMITHEGPDGPRALVGRQPRFPPGNYSCLAGFLEPGETVEAAVRREVAEEAGITVGAVRYHASQPWPLPHSLMLGCYGEALTDTIVPDEEELEDVRWVTRDELHAMREDRHPEGMRTPPAGTIARLLFDDWLDAS